MILAFSVNDPFPDPPSITGNGYVLSRGLHWEPQLTILAFSVNDPLPDLPNFPQNG